MSKEVKNGILEYWNSGILGYTDCFLIIPTFQHSIIP
jgi:predicted glycoside hydrolase/deacetylase ChbG (UPF0249 family)